MAAPISPANAQRDNPYRSFRVQVVFDGRPVAGLSKMGTLKKTTEVVDRHTTGDPAHQRAMPSGTTFENVSLEQGLSHDPVFQQWANAVNMVADADAGMKLPDYRRDIVINVMDLQGVPAVSYQFRRAWVTECTLLPGFDADSQNAVAIQAITIAYEGSVHKKAVTGPTED